MKTKKPSFIVIALALIALAGCTPSNNSGIIINPGNSQTTLTFKDAAKAIDEGRALVDALNKVHGTSYAYLEEAPTSSMTLMQESGASETKDVYIRVSFSGGYNNGECIINSGYIDYSMSIEVDSTVQEAVANDVVYTANASQLSVKTSNSRNSVTMDAAGLSGTIEEITVSTTTTGVTIDIEENTTITQDVTTGSFTANGDTITVAESEDLSSDGEGTEASPFEITTIEQLKSLSALSGKTKDDPTYVTIMNDLVIPANEEISGIIRNMVIAGAGDGITISLSGEQDDKTPSGNLFSTLYDATVKNINYNLGTNTKVFIRNAYGDVTLDDIVISGAITVTSNNTSAFIAYTYPTDEGHGNIKFNKCVNKVSFNDIGYNYGAPFVAFSLRDGNYGVNFTFTDCSNEADIFYGNWASLLIGNAYNGATPESVTVTNFTNTGTISSFGTIAFCSHNSSVENKVDTTTVTGFDDNHKNKRPTTGINIEATSDGKLKFTTSSGLSEIERIRLIGIVYITYLDNNIHRAHYANYNMEIAETTKAEGFEFDRPPLEVIGSYAYSGTAEDDTVVTHNGKQYWYVGPSHDGMVSFAGEVSEDQKPEENATGIAEFKSYVAIGSNAEGDYVARVNISEIPETGI